MGSKKVVEVVYGKSSKYEIVEESTFISGSKYHVRKNGKPFKGSYSSLRAAVEAAEAAG